MEKYLDKCLTSLIIEDKELMKQLEVLIVIDGAKDRSSDIAHTYQNRFPETFRVIDKENGNYGSCVNRGLEEATGKYIKILDADDSFDTINFHKYLLLLSKRDDDMILTPFVIVNEQGEITGRWKYNFPDNQVISWKELTKVLKVTSLQMHAVTYKTENVRSLNYKQTEGISYTDQEWVFTPLYAVDSIYYANIFLYKYLIGRSGQTVSPEALRKNVSNNVLCVKRILLDYSNLSTDNAFKADYLTFKCYSSVVRVYDWCLLKYYQTDICLINDFDEFVKQTNLKFYKLLNQEAIKFFPLKFVKKWRRNKSNSLGVKYLMIYYLSKLIDRIISKLS